MRSFLAPALSLLLLFAGLQHSLAAGLPQATSSTGAQTASTPPHTTTQPDYSKEGFVIEQIHSRYRFENDGTGLREDSRVIRIQGEDGVHRWGELVFGYNSASERLDIVYVRVRKPDGHVITAGPESVQDRSGPLQNAAPVYTDFRLKYVSVPALRPGDVLETKAVTLVQKPWTPGDFWMQHEFVQSGSIVLDEELEIDVPAARAIKLKTRPGLDPAVTVQNDRRIYRWNTSQLTREEDNNGKDVKKKRPKADQSPAVELSTFTTWEQVGDWYASLEKSPRTPTPEIRAKAVALTKGLTTDLEKTEALYTFVAQTFRYVSLSLGEARYQPHPAAEVLRNQYGDCKDKHTLLAALLEAEGLHASSVLINSKRKLDLDVPSPAQFDHVITLLPLGSDQVWMDTTTEVAPFRLLAYPLRKKQALVIPAEGKPHLQETPADPPMPDLELTQIEGKITEDGKLEANVKFTARGDSELTERLIFRSMPSAEWGQFVKGMNRGLGGDVHNVKVADPTATHEPFTVSYDVTAPHFVDLSKKKQDLKLPLSRLTLRAVSSEVDDEGDDNSLSGSESFQIGPPNQHTYTLKLEAPSKYSVHAPLPIKVERDYADYHSTYQLNGTSFSAERSLNLRQGELPPSRADDYRAFRRSVLADAAQTIAVENPTADANAQAADAKPSDLIESGNDARRNGNLAQAEELLNRAVTADPKSKLGWNDLGLAYLDDRKDDLAAQAFRKQIEINPYDDYAYNNLGRIYLRQRNYDEASKWFNKQLEVQPLDKYAHGNLGQVLLEQHKYAEAIPELEKAASINPTASDFQVRLGTAYLNLSQDEKAMSAFDQALKTASTPPTWNSIAYQLSLKGVHLDRARNYAESAVTNTTATLRNVSPTLVARRDILLVSSLASYWDTLGWVAFAEGNLDVAWRYVLAAWQLSERSENADHLGQIAEKRGNKEDTLRYYSLALLARRPDPETQSRLAAFAGGAGNVTSSLDKYRDEFQKLRVLTVPNTSNLDGNADFLVFLTKGPNAAAAVESVRFVSGDEALKPAADTLQTLKYTQSFPDDTPVKLIRRGTLSCKPATGCTLTLALPEDVRSIN